LNKPTVSVEGRNKDKVALKRSWTSADIMLVTA
jgi:hypothetical protein